MIASFRNGATEDVFDGRDSARARRICPPRAWPKARRLLDQLQHSGSLQELRTPPGNRLEKLRGRRGGTYSLRIDRQYRICFVWEGAHAYDVHITDYH